MISNYQILEVKCSTLKKKYTEHILRGLPEWFGQEDSLIEYVKTVGDHPFFGAFENDECIGFFSGIIHHEQTGDVYVCGINSKHHRKGLEQKLYQELEQYFIKKGCEHVMVKTLSSLHPNKHYALTRNFYEAMGFKEFYTNHEMWGKECPCLIMVKSLSYAR